MNTANESQKKQLTPLNRTQIAKAIFAAAESMGIPDRHQIEQLTTQVIERLEQQQPLAGMEQLVPKSRRQKKRLPTDQVITNDLIKAANDFDRERVERDAKNFKLNDTWKNVEVTGNW